MKLQFKSPEQDSLSSIMARRVHRPHMGGDWHFHKEFELIYFLKGQGMRIVGDHISNFKKGELVLVGQWLPHLWRNDEDKVESDATDFIVVKFTRMFGEVDLFSMPELLHIKALLKEAKQGILFSKKVNYFFVILMNYLFTFFHGFHVMFIKDLSYHVQTVNHLQQDLLQDALQVRLCSVYFICNSKDIFGYNCTKLLPCKKINIV